jgi:hypothetical protein
MHVGEVYIFSSTLVHTIIQYYKLAICFIKAVTKYKYIYSILNKLSCRRMPIIVLYFIHISNNAKITASYKCVVPPFMMLT